MTGHQLRDFRLSYGLTQLQFARVIGATMTTVSRWECERVGISELVEAGMRRKMRLWLARRAKRAKKLLAKSAKNS